jgi:hypothetical protein
MSTNYNSNTIYGVFLDVDLVETMKSDIPPVIEIQERFNEFTGRSLGKKNVKIRDGFRALMFGATGDFFGEGSECGGTTVEGLNAIMSDHVNIKLQAWASQHQSGQIYGYIIGMSIKDKTSSMAIKAIKLVDKHANQINKVLNTWLKGKPTRVNPDGYSSSDAEKFIEKPMVHSILEVY